MAEYSKKLHVLKNNVVTDIKLYTTADEVGSPSFHILDGATEVYAKLGEVSDANASPLRVLYSGTTYAVLTQAAPAVPTGSFDIPSGTPGGRTFNLTIPTGVTVIKASFPARSLCSYVGVTPGKTYTLTYGTEGNLPYNSYSGVMTNYMTPGVIHWIQVTLSGAAALQLEALIEWSPDINTQTPAVTDY